MPNGKTTDITHLFYLAFDWYSTHPGEHIPLEIWDEKADEYGILEDEWRITIGNRQISNIQTTVIPVLAAINLGFAPNQLVSVIKHHGMDSSDFLGCTYTKLLTKEAICIPGTQTSYILDGWSINGQIVSAMCLDPQLSEDLSSELPDYENTYGTDFEFELSCLLSPNKNLWPQTLLEKFLKKREGKVLEAEATPPSLTSISAFIYSDIDFHSLEHEDILLILERSGQLSPDAVSEKGFDTGFFQQLFIGLNKHKTHGLFHLIEAINSVEQPSLLKRISDSILRSLPDNCVLSNQDGASILRMMDNHLDKDRYSEVFNSMVIKLNVAPHLALSSIQKNLTLGSNLPALRDFIESGDKILKRLCDELDFIDPSEFSLPQFSAIDSFLSHWQVPQDFSGIDLHGLLVKTLYALDAYQAATHYSYGGEITDKSAAFATKQVERLSKYVSLNVSVDYTRFVDLPSRQKALLAANGFDLRKLPGVNNRDKGDLLSHELGL
jgi:hypothetical protein